MSNFIEFTKDELTELYAIKAKLNSMCIAHDTLDCTNCPLQANDEEYCILYAITDTLENYERRQKK